MGAEEVWRQRLRREFGLEGPRGADAGELRRLYLAAVEGGGGVTGDDGEDGGNGGDVIDPVAPGGSSPAGDDRPDSPRTVQERGTVVHDAPLGAPPAARRRVGRAPARSGGALERVEVAARSLEEAERERDEAVAAAVEAGCTVRSVAEAAGLGKSRVGEISVRVRRAR